MDDSVAKAINVWAEQHSHKVDLAGAVPVSGGSINDAWRITLNRSPAFLKARRSPHLDMFNKEAIGLEALREATESFRIPEVYHVHEQFLLLEYIPSKSTSAQDDEAAGRALAEMHLNVQRYFGFYSDNFIATLTQRNTREKNWARFFINHRLRPLLAGSLAIRNQDLEKVLEDVAIYIRYKVPSEHPVLLHGDLWSGNRMTDPRGRPVLVDPAVYYGHREMDIGMTTLFGGFSSHFYEAYQEVYPLEPGWRDRILLCNLYPLLVHERLFGASYSDTVRTNLVELGLLK